jgi:hypothetical protein
MSTPDTSSTGNVIELKTFAGAGLGAEDDSELPEAVREFDEVLGATLMIASMLPGLPLPANPATANMLFACGAMLIRAFRQAVAYYRDEAAADLDDEIARLADMREVLAAKADARDAIRARFPALLEVIEDSLPPARMPLGLQLELEALKAALGL